MKNQHFQGIVNTVESVENVDTKGNQACEGEKISTYLMCVFTF